MKFGSSQASSISIATIIQVTNCPFGTGDGVTTTFQAMRQTTIGGLELQRAGARLQRHADDLCERRRDRRLHGRDLRHDHVHDAAGRGAVLSWTGSYFFLCRFDKDELDLSKIGQGLWANGAIRF
jgi:hypothetical protein